MTGYIELYPRSWSPDLTRTGGDRPPSVVMIPREAWEAAGKPESIEDWQRAIAIDLRCTCGSCPVHGFGSVKP